MCDNSCFGCVHLAGFRDHGASLEVCSLESSLGPAIARCKKGKCPLYFTCTMAVASSLRTQSLVDHDSLLSYFVCPSIEVTEGLSMIYERNLSD